MFTANVEKKRKEVSVSNPRVQIKLPIDVALFKLCHSLIILPHGFSWCIHHHHHHHSLFSIYPFTATTKGCGNSHNVLYNVSVKSQMSNDRRQL